MNILRYEPRTTVRDVENDTNYLQFLSEVHADIAFVPQPMGEQDKPGLLSDYGDFMKWLAAEQPNISISVPSNTQKIILRSAEIWLPLAYLASDTSVQIFLNMVASYLYDRAKGGLKEEKARVNFSVEYQDKNVGKTKRLEFSGDVEALEKAIKRFDINNFFNDAP